MSFFDDGEETAPRPAARAQRPRRQAAPRCRVGRRARKAPSTPPAALARRDARDEHTVMVRRRIAAGVGVVLLIVIVLLVNGCLNSQKAQALKEYAHNVSAIANESDQQVSRPLFAALTDASAKSALDVEEQVNQLRLEAQKQASRAKGLSVPGRNGRVPAESAAGDGPARRRRRKGGEPAAHRAGRTGQAGEHSDRRGHGELPGLRRDLLPAGRAADRTDAEVGGDRRPDRRQLAFPAEHRLA